MKKMIKVALVLVVVTVIILAIVNSCARNKSYDYQTVVTYNSNNTQVATMNNEKVGNKNELGVIGNVLRYEQVILISSIILVVIFTIIFLNLNPKKR